MAAKIIHLVTDADQLVTLIQQGKDRFSVVYGLQVKSDLTYSEAAPTGGTDNGRWTRPHYYDNTATA